ncbi:MAG: GAF domain-containing protein, partial [Acidobacteriota bacterium]
MTESVPETGSDTDAAKDTSAAQGPDRASGDRADLLVHLESLHELQIALSQEERDDEILRIGTAAAVEILGADCGLAIVRSDDGAATLRFGWREGAQLAKHEVEILIRNLNPALQSVRNGTAHRVVLAAEPNVGEVEIEGEPSGALQSRGLGSVLVLGLGKGGGRLGELVFGCREPVPFSPDRLLLAEILAMQLAVQIERARRTNEARDATARSHRDVETATRPLRERNQELESLSAVAAAVAPSFELERQLDQILRRAAEVTGHEGGAIYLVETDADGGERLKLVQCLDARERSGPAAAEGLRAGEGLAGRVWERDEIVALADLRADPDAAAREDLVNAGFHGILMAPLRARGRVIGVLELVSREERFYLDDEQQLAQAIAAQVGLMIQNSRLLSDLMRHSLDLEGRAEQNVHELNRKSLQSGAVHAVIRSVTSQGDPEAVLVSSLESVLDLLGAEVGIVHLLDPKTGSITLAARCGTPQETEVLETLLRDAPAVRRAIDSRECQVCERPGGEGAPGEWPDGAAPVQVLVVVPLLSLGRVVGVLSVGSTEVLELGEEERDCLAS